MAITVNIDGVGRNVPTPQVNIDGIWREVATVSNNIDGVWRPVLGTFDFVVTKDNRDMIGFTDETTELDIPSNFVYKGVEYNVVGIGDYAFEKCSTIVSITLPNSIDSIGDYAFSECTALNGIDIPNSVTHVGNYTFKNCSSLTSIIVPVTVNSLGDYVFAGCTNLKTATIESQVTSLIGTFANCQALTSVNIPDTVTHLGRNVFGTCKSLTSPPISDFVTSIGYAAFANCTGFTSVSLPNSVVEMGDYVFTACSNIQYFSSGGLTVLNPTQFLGLKLETIVLDNVVEIGSQTFSNISVSNPISLIMSTSVKKIGQYIFNANINVQLTIYYKGTEEQWNDIEIESPNNENDPINTATKVFNYTD